MERKYFQAVDKFLSFIEDWALFLSVSLALVVAMANIILRKFTPISLYWSDEVVRKVIFFSTFVGCSAAIKSRALIRVDALPQLFPGLQKLLTYVHHLGVVVFSVLMIKIGYAMTAEVFHDEYARTATLQIQEGYFYAILPIVGVMMLVRTLMLMIADWKTAGEKPKG
jgi:TRAP-type C4-dicarboxylate transport system permease small subunit